MVGAAEEDGGLLATLDGSYDRVDEPFVDEVLGCCRLWQRGLLPEKRV
jgi:hypothetical protein